MSCRRGRISSEMSLDWLTEHHLGALQPVERISSSSRFWRLRVMLAESFASRHDGLRLAGDLQAADLSTPSAFRMYRRVPSGASNHWYGVGRSIESVGRRVTGRARSER